jgi:nucleoside-diphosphate-sugar epimerase
MNVLITGAAGNLGRLLARHITACERGLDLVLMEHRTPVPADLRRHPKVTVRNADLSRPETLDSCLEGADVVVHFAGVLFKADPEKFLFETNIRYFENLVEAASRKGIRKIILISFPHVEGPTSRLKPAKERLDGNPVSVHAMTRLAEEKLLMKSVEKPVSLRVGMVYGKGILMVDAARWFAKRRLLGVWTEPTEIHLISKTDFCRAVVAAVKSDNARGIYNVGDEGTDTLQSFLDVACGLWGCGKPWRMPLSLIYSAAAVFEMFSRTFNTKSPLTKDFIDIGRVSYYGDTTRFRQELLPDLVFKTVYDGISEFGDQTLK